MNHHTPFAALTMAAALLTVPALSGADRYVDNQNAQASDSNPGTAARPYKTITAGVVALAAGDHVYIKAGEYRETVNVYAYTGTASQPVVIQAYPGDEGKVFIKGSDIVTYWAYEYGSQWSTSWTYRLPSAYPSDWPTGPEFDQAYIRRVELAFVDGQALKQVTSRGAMTAGTFFADDGAQRLYVWLSDSSAPGSHRMELAVRQVGMVFGGFHYKVSGLDVTHVANQYGSAAFAVFGSDIEVSNNVVEWNNLDGLRVDATRATVTSNIMRNNGGAGIVGSPQSGVFDSNATNSNSWRFGPDHHAGGIKFVGGGPSNNVIKHHTSRDNYGPGIWCDTYCQNNRIEECLIVNNTLAGIFLENSGSNTVVNNIVLQSRAWTAQPWISGAGLLLSSVDTPLVYNNTIAANDRYGIMVYGDMRNYRPQNSRIFNNVIASNTLGGLYFAVSGSSATSSVLASHQSDYNLWYQTSGYFVNYPVNGKEAEAKTLSQWQGAYGQDQHSRSGDPQFVNLSSLDVHVQSGSPAIDSGTSIGVTQDYSGASRPQGNGYDIGAYEQAGSASATASTVKHLSDLTWTSMSNGWGPAENDRSNGEKGASDGHTLTLRGIAYAKGLGAHAYSNIQYNLSAAGTCSAFLSDIGVDDEALGRGSVVFQVWADGTKLYDSGVVTGSMAVKTTSVTIAGKSLLTLIVTDAGDGNAHDHADWANARLQCQ
jgi:parallel beta-helix repeat protein